MKIFIYSVKRSLAINTNLNLDIFSILSLDDDIEVRYCIAKNPFLFTDTSNHNKFMVFVNEIMGRLNSKLV